MSEQLSIPAGGGLLSLNLSVLPQGTPLNASGQPGGASGFGSMLGQQGAQGEQSSGFFLPPSGGALPLGDEPLSQNEMMQQQLAHLAQMLEQQQSSSEGELPAQLASELAKALRRYSEEGAVLPDMADGASQTALDATNEEGAAPLNTAQVPTPETVSLPEPVVQIPEEEVSIPVDLSSVEGDEQVVPVVQSEERRSGDVRPAAVGEVPSVPAGWSENGLPKGVEVSSLHRAEPAGNHPLESRQQTGSEQPLVRQEPQVQPAPVSEAVSRAQEVAANPLPIKESSPQQKIDRADVMSTAASASPLSERKVVPSVMQSTEGELENDEFLLRRTELLDQRRPLNTQEGILGERKVATSIRAAGSEPVVNMVDNSGKPLGELPVGTKLESTLDATQQLLQKVAATERAIESASMSRSETSSTSALNNSPAQSILQPAPAQKAVTEGHTLMMPNQMRMSSPAWNNALGDRAIWIAAQNNRVAEIKLDPPELGSLNVRIQINQDQVNLSFTSPHAHVRDAVEQSLPRLREMFAEQGLELQDSSVSDQSKDEQRERFTESGGESSGYSSGVNDADSELPEAQEQQSIGLVDYYA